MLPSQPPCNDDGADDSQDAGLPEPAQCPSPHLLCTPPRRSSLTPPPHPGSHSRTLHHRTRSGSVGVWPPRTPLGGGSPGAGWAAVPPHTPHGVGTQQPHTLWVVEERFGDRTLATQLERGLMSWRQVRARVRVRTGAGASMGVCSCTRVGSWERAGAQVPYALVQAGERARVRLVGWAPGARLHPAQHGNRGAAVHQLREGLGKEGGAPALHTFSARKAC